MIYRLLVSDKNSPQIIRWSPDSKLIAGGDLYGNVTVFDVESTNELFTKKLFPENYSSVTSLEWSPDGTTVIAGSRFVSCIECKPTYGGKIAFLDIRKKDILQQINVGEVVNYLALTSDGKLLAAGLRSDEARVYRTSEGGMVASNSGIGANGVDWLPDGQRLVSTNGYNALVTWDILSERQSSSLVDGFVQIYNLVWSPNGSQIATSTPEGPVFIWDIDTGQILQKFGNNNGLDVAWSPNGNQVASTEGNLQINIWDVESGKLVKSLASSGDYPKSPDWSKDGRYFASISACDIPGKQRNCIIDIWDAVHWNLLKTFLIDDYENFLAWSPDGKVLATEGTEISLWNSASGNLIQSFKQDNAGGSSARLSWSPDGSKLVTGSGAIWDVSTGKLIMQLIRNDTVGVTSTALSPNGKLLAAGGTYVSLYEVQTGNLMQTINGYDGRVEKLAFSPNGKMLASVCDDGTIILWDVKP